ncbi:MAG: uracil-DNA glycosylase [Gammaproteobacteria bacterium]|nr:uracil-DNA glycosylase [Gammaproteobacteria bacterium]
MSAQTLHKQFRQLAKRIDGIDKDVYLQYKQDPLEPVIGEGNPDSSLAFFGRDPGRDEVKYHMPFIGAGGQKVRTTLYKHLYNKEMPDFEASLHVGKHFFWANTCPYKPVGNKAWSMKIKKQFQPIVADLLMDLWHGNQIITLGREAFLWFAINQPKEVKLQLEEFWATEDRFSNTTTICIHSQDGRSRQITLNPLPHPSPLNATWYKRFPELLDQRLKQLKVTV